MQKMIFQLRSLREEIDGSKRNLSFVKMKEAGKSVRPWEVVNLTGIAKDETSTLIQTLKKQGTVISPMCCFWEPAQ